MFILSNWQPTAMLGYWPSHLTQNQSLHNIAHISLYHRQSTQFKCCSVGKMNTWCVEYYLAIKKEKITDILYLQDKKTAHCVIPFLWHYIGELTQRTVDQPCILTWWSHKSMQMVEFLGCLHGCSVPSWGTTSAEVMCSDFRWSPRSPFLGTFPCLALRARCRWCYILTGITY